MWAQSSVLAHFSLCADRLSVCAVDYFYKAFGYLSAWDKQIVLGRICMCVLVFGCVCVCVCVCDRLTSGKLLMLTIMTWGDFMETWPSWLRGNFPSRVVTTMWSRAPTQIHINQIVYTLTSFYLHGLSLVSLNCCQVHCALSKDI